MTQNRCVGQQRKMSHGVHGESKVSKNHRTDRNAFCAKRIGSLLGGPLWLCFLRDLREKPSFAAHTAMLARSPESPAAKPAPLDTHPPS
jgi:hypothetical protein